MVSRYCHTIQWKFHVLFSLLFKYNGSNSHNRKIKNKRIFSVKRNIFFRCVCVCFFFLTNASKFVSKWTYVITIIFINPNYLITIIECRSASFGKFNHHESGHSFHLRNQKTHRISTSVRMLIGYYKSINPWFMVLIEFLCPKSVHS